MTDDMEIAKDRLQHLARNMGAKLAQDMCDIINGVYSSPDMATIVHAVAEGIRERLAQRYALLHGPEVLSIASISWINPKVRVPEKFKDVIVTSTQTGDTCTAYWNGSGWQLGNQIKLDVDAWCEYPIGYR